MPQGWVVSPFPGGSPPAVSIANQRLEANSQIYKAVDFTGVKQLTISYDARHNWLVNGEIAASGFAGAGIALFSIAEPNPALPLVFTSATLGRGYFVGRRIYYSGVNRRILDDYNVFPTGTADFHFTTTFRDGIISQTLTDTISLAKYSSGDLAAPGFQLSSINYLGLEVGANQAGASAWIDNAVITTMMVVSTCAPTQVLQNGACVTPPPIASGVSVVGYFDNNKYIGATGTATGFNLSMVNSEFIVNIQIAVKTTLDIGLKGIKDLLDSWESAINNLWSRGTVFDADTGIVHKVKMNVDFVSDSDPHYSVMELLGNLGSDNPACRDLKQIPLSCHAGIPRVDPNGVMHMFTGAQHFCYDENNKQINCTTADVLQYYPTIDKNDTAALESKLLTCQDVKGVVIPGSKCLDFGWMQPFTAAHEFGHLIGLPDQYNLKDPYNLCMNDSDVKGGVLGCKRFTGDKPGLMSALTLETQFSDYKLLFDSWNGLIPGHEFFAGLSPSWVNEFAIDPRIEAPTLFEIPVATDIPEPGTHALLLVAFGLMVMSMRQQRHKYHLNP